MKTNILFILFALFLATGLMLAQQESDTTHRQILEAIATLKPLHVYGKVVDQYGTPVPGVRVLVSWTEARIPPDPGQSKWIEANALGEWTIEINKPDRVFVRDLEKEGYDFDRKASAYFNALNREQLIRETSKQNPLIITMRKKDSPTFLMHHRGRVDFVPPGGAKVISLIDMTDMTGKKAFNNKDKPLWDLRIDSNFREKDQKWEFTITPSGETQGGIYVSDSPFYTAPAQGYLTEHHESVSLKEFRKNLLLCVRSRSHTVYSRVDLQFSAGEERCILSYDAWVNPYGSRNLEYDEELDKAWQLRKRLEQEVRADIREGKLTKEHDLNTLKKTEIEID